MRSEDFNRMLHAARELLRHYHAGVETDPHTVRWAQTLVAANPNDKRRPSPIIDALMALFDDPATRLGGVTGHDAADRTGLPQRTVHQMLYRLKRTNRLFLLRGPGEKAGRYFLTAADRDAAEKAAPARQTGDIGRANRVAAGAVAKTEKTPKIAQNPKKEPKMKIPRLAKTPPPRPSRAKTEPGQGAMTPARKEFNGTDNDPHAKMADKTAKFIARNNTNFNPDLGQAMARKKAKAVGRVATRDEWAKMEATTPPSVTVQICPGFRAPHERMATEGVFGAGFQAVGIGRNPLTGKAW